VRGPEIFADMLTDESYYHALMELITTASIQRIRAWRVLCGIEARPEHGTEIDAKVIG
jgi:hypothetical protein